jgi:hypothetical protein
MKSDSGKVKMKRVRNFNLINYDNKYEISNDIKNTYFTEFATLRDTSGLPLYGYNLNDERFWISKIWDEYFKER